MIGFIIIICLIGMSQGDNKLEIMKYIETLENKLLFPIYHTIYRKNIVGYTTLPSQITFINNRVNCLHIGNNNHIAKDCVHIPNMDLSENKIDYLIHSNIKKITIEKWDDFLHIHNKVILPDNIIDICSITSLEEIRFVDINPVIFMEIEKNIRYSKICNSVNFIFENCDIKADFYGFLVGNIKSVIIINSPSMINMANSLKKM